VEAFSPTVKFSKASPLPLVADVKVIQLEVVDALHAHGLLTVIVPFPPAGGKPALAGDTETVHTVPCCVIWNAWPLTSINPDLSPASVFGAAQNTTRPLPEPLAPSFNVIHAEFAAADHVQPSSAVTSKPPVPPPDGISAPFGAIETVQARPACVIVTDCAPTVTLPVRDCVEEFAVTEKLIPALPVPELAELT
jgi:hypothetical protein